MKYTKKDLIKKVEILLNKDDIGAVAIFNKFHDGYGFAEVVKSSNELLNIIDKLESSSDFEDKETLYELFNYDLAIVPLKKGKVYIWDTEYYNCSIEHSVYTTIEEYKEPTDLIFV